jgi:hypothetical protein
MVILLCSVFLLGSTQTELEKTIDAIRRVESSGRTNPPDGDRGKAIGPYQIHLSYWKDATQFLNVQWPYSDARNTTKARKAVQAYLLHYQPNGNAETWSRVHNGGPSGHKKPCTITYWAKVRRIEAMRIEAIRVTQPLKNVNYPSNKQR